MNIYEWINLISFAKDSEEAMIALIQGPRSFV